jgi:TetR/AcrR family transcriptional regulator, regulator of autoinduction and epiphytic fitness
MDGVTVVDGRTQRGARNREAIIDALIACYDNGELRPSVQQVADRAGVSARSVHNHFADVEALCAEVSQRQWERFSHLAVIIDVTSPVSERVEQLVAQRAEIFEGLTPVRRAALLMAPDSPTIVANLARLDRTLRHQIERGFPGITPDVLDAVDALASWDAWNRLRAAQGVAMPRARRILANAICTLLEGLTDDEGDA